MRHCTHRALRRYVARGRISGFTLVELLVVIAILSFLAGMLLPALGKALATARTVACASHEKQLAMGVVQFSDDYRGYLPCGLYADNKLPPYEDELFPPQSHTSGSSRSWSNAPTVNLFWPYYARLGEILCPSHPSRELLLAYFRRNVRDRGYWWQPSGTYAIAQDQVSCSCYAGTVFYERRRRLGQIVHPSQLFMFVEQDGTATSGGRQTYAERYYGASSFYKLPRYHQGFNALFFDGHSRFYVLPRDIDWALDYKDGCIQTFGMERHNWRQ